MTPKQWNWLILIIFAINLILISICIYQIKGEKDNCISNPLIYGADRLTEANKATFSCTCSLSKPNSPIITFDSKGMEVKSPFKITFDSKGMEVKSPSNENDYKEEFNFSKFMEKAH